MDKLPNYKTLDYLMDNLFHESFNGAIKNFQESTMKISMQREMFLFSICILFGVNKIG